MKKNGYIKENDRIIRNNIGTLIKFEFTYKIILGLILLPLAVMLFNITMNFTGYKYLTIENIFSFLLNPITIILLLIIIIFLTIITIFDLGTIIIIYDSSYQDKKIALLDAIKISYKKCLKLVRPNNIGVAFLVLFLIPFLNIGIGTNVISSIKIPEFILDYIKGNTVLTVLLVLLYLLFAFLLLRWIFTLHYMILEEKNYKDATKCSANLISGNIKNDIVILVIVQIIYALIYIVFLLVGLIIIYILFKLLNNFKIVESILISIVAIFIGLYLIFTSILSNAVSYSLISVLFYKHKTDKKEEIKNISNIRKVKVRTLSNKIKYALLITVLLTIMGGSVFTYQILTGKTNFNIENVRNMEITAHRGSSKKYPENTMAAFKAAKEEGADFIELDVQMSKDGKIVVCHDSNLNRIAGINKSINDLTYDEITLIDVGSHFSDEFKDERIPLLSDVISFASKNNIRLNIELKQTGKEKDFEKEVINIINKYNYKDMSVLTSGKYEVLKKVKRIDRSIKTVYVMSLAVGDITSLKYVDAFSLEATNVTKKQVNRVHNAGKEVYAWTVNTEESINKMIDMGVDNIITDDVPLGKELVLNSNNSKFVRELIKLLSK